MAPATLAATQWKSSTGTGLRLRLESSAPVARIAFAVPAAMLPKRGDARRVVGRITIYPARGGARRWTLTQPRSGGVLLAGRDAPRVEVGRGVVRVSGLSAGVGQVRLTVYTRDRTSPAALVTKGRAVDLAASVRTAEGRLLRAAHRLAGTGAIDTTSSGARGRL